MVITAKTSTANLSYSPLKTKFTNEQEQLSPDVNSKKVVVKVLLPNCQTTTIKVLETLTVKSILYSLCEKRALDFACHRLELASNPGTPLDADSTIQSISKEGVVTEVLVARFERPEETICISENGKEVLIIKITGDG
jgi:hypothetical protein